MSVIKFLSKIIRITLDKLRNEEHFRFMTIIRAFLGLKTPEEMGLTPELVTKFESYYNAEDISLEQLVKSGYTDKIKNADSERDDIFKYLKNTVKTFLKHFDAAKREAAETLIILFDKYGDVAAKDYDNETAAVYNITQDLYDKYSAEVALLGIADSVEKLEELNDICGSLIDNRDLEKSEKPAIKVPEARKAIDECYMEIVARIEAFMLLNPAHGLESEINKLNATVTRYNNRLAQRKGRAKVSDTMLETLDNTEKVAVIEQNGQIANQNQPHWTPVPPRDNDKPFEK